MRLPRAILSLVTILTSLPACADERVVLVAGGNEPTASVAAQVKLLELFGVDIAADGKMYLIEMTGHRFSVISPQGEFQALAGNGKPGSGGDDGPAANAQLNGPHSLALTSKGDVYIADTWNHRVRRFEPGAGIIHPFAGTGEKGFGGDSGPAAKAMFGDVYCIAFDADDRHLLIADLDNRRIRSIDMQTSAVTTVAGNGQKGIPKDGDSATQSTLVDPRAVAADKQGNIYILERGGHALRVVDAQGKIRTVAGTGKAGLSGDGGDALQATLNGPKHLCVDRDGSVLIADSENHVIRRYDPQTGKITRVAGTGKRGSVGLNGPPLELELDRPHGVYVSREGVLFISDSGNGRVLKIEK